MLNRLKRPEEAIECYDQALAVDPQDAMTWNNKGETLAGSDAIKKRLAATAVR